MRHIQAIIVAMVLAACATPTLAQDTTTDSAGSLRQQVVELRQQLAVTKLALDKAMAELGEINQFLAQDNRDQQMADWQTARRALEDERRRVMAERRKLEAARQLLHRTTTAQAAGDVEAAEQAAEAESAKPKWNVQYMIGLIDKEQEQIYLRVVNGRVVRLRRFANIDTRNVMVRGTFVNKSPVPWRYTFEIRIAGDQSIGLPTGSNLNGKWRYQTPVLDPGELHEFEVKVPVANVYDIETVQIGNVTADRPLAPTSPAGAPAVPDSGETRRLPQTPSL